jgi:hypothetical protein
MNRKHARRPGFRGCVRTEKKPQISPLRYPGFPVEFGGVDDLNAAFLNESRTRGHVQRRAAGNPGAPPGQSHDDQNGDDQNGDQNGDRQEVHLPRSHGYNVLSVNEF